MGRETLSGAGQDAVRVRQHTLKTSISCTGTGLHSGDKVTMTLHPAGPDEGIVFRRIDLAGRGASIPALWNHVVDTRMCTTLGDGGSVRIGTVEHLMAALAGCGIDNVVVELNGTEVPIMDGSAAPFVFLIECAGVALQDAPRRAIQVLKPISVGDHEKTAILTPGRGSSVSFEIDFESSVIARQEYYVNLEDGVFQSEISRARTFGFDHEVATLRAMGLARGGSLENAIVVSGDHILNDDGLRYEDEFVRHKVLDSIGDLYLAGAPLIGHYHGYRSGHGLNNMLLRALFKNTGAWQYTTFDERGVAAVPQPGWRPAAVAASA